MRQSYSRREALRIGLGSLAGLSMFELNACDGATPGASGVGSHIGMHLLFWGTATRNTLTGKAINAFVQHYPNVSISSQYMVFNDYWPKMDKLIASGATPDVFQMDMRYVAKYARQNLMLDLTQLIYQQTIVLSDFDPLMLDGSKANNAIYGIPLGGNYQCLLYDSVLVENSGVGPLPTNLNWDEFAQYATALAGVLGKTIYGVGDSSGDLSVYEIWIRQRGKELYTVGGGLAFTMQDVADWFDYWNRLRISGGCVPADITALYTGGGAANSTLVHGKSVFVMPHTNEFESYQAALKHTLNLALLPSGDQPGLYYKPSMLMSVAANTPYRDAAVRFVDFLINDPQGIKAIGMERGIPGSLKAQALLTPNFTPTQQKELDFSNFVAKSGRVRLKEVLDPPAASQVATLFTKASTDVSSKKSTVVEGAQAFYAAAQKVLK